ncbi:MAG: hypothetical protein ABEN55_06815 [Bradymonadaceae bacterium]
MSTPSRLRDYSHLEDDVRYSTESSDWRPTGRYVSANHAVSTYLKLTGQLEGLPAIDYREALAVDTSPDPDNPAGERAAERVFLERVFARVRGKVGPSKWRVWGGVRFELMSLRAVARQESAERRRRIERCRELEGLRTLMERWGCPDPTDQETLAAWAKSRGLHVWPWAGAPWEAAKDICGISRETAKTYRDEVDAKVEQMLSGRGVFVSDAVRDYEDVREDMKTEVLKRQTEESS